MIEYFPKEETLPPFIEEYTPSHRGDTDFYNNPVKRRIEQLNVSEPQPIGALCILPVRNQQGHITACRGARTPLSTDSGIFSPENQLLLTPTTPNHPSTSRPSPILTLTQQPTPDPPPNNQKSSKSTIPLQDLRRAVARHKGRNPRYQRSQPNQAYFTVTHHHPILDELLSYMPTLILDLQSSPLATQKDLFC